MYSQGYGAQSPQLTNNPFINDPSNPHSRFPDISSINQDPNPGQYSSQWVQSPGGDNNATLFSNGGIGMSPPPQPGQHFQPSSGFGQQLVAQVNATGYGQLPGQTQPQSPGYPAQYQNSYQTGYPQQQQQPQSQYNTGYPAQQQQYNTGLQSGYGQQQMQSQLPAYQDVAQFDPYGPIAQGWGENPNQSQNQSQPSSTTYNGNPHPREFIRTHKAELEIWDPYAWKQVLNAFDGLKDAWAARKRDAEGRIAQVQRDYGYTGQQEVARLQGVLKDAESKFDSVAASSFQMHEVYNGYRQSSDLASKRRVREATNAALSNLTDWPAQGF